jgi:hypothetical protein
VSEARSPRYDFRVLTRRRGGYDGAAMVDVQLQVAATGPWCGPRRSPTSAQADAFQRELEDDLTSMDAASFRRKYGVPPST